MTPTLTRLNNRETDSEADVLNSFASRHRQTAALVFIAVALIAAVAALAYVAGRMSAGTAAAGKGSEQFIVVDAPNGAPSAPHAAASAPRVMPAPARPPALPVSPATSPAVNPPVRPVAPAAPLTHPPVQSPGTARPAAQGEPAATAKAPLSPAPPASWPQGDYFQVAAVERGMAEVSAEYLRKRGLPALVGDMASPGVYRVLVGPMRDAQQTGEIRTTLEKLGFRPFLRRL